MNTNDLIRRVGPRNFLRIGFATVWLGLTAFSSLYMYYLKAPSVVAARPEIANINGWDALFSGRFNSWLWYNNPEVGFVFTFLTVGLVMFAAYLSVVWGN